MKRPAFVPYVKVWQDWTEWLRPSQCNWLEFRLVNVYFERDHVCGTYDIYFGLCGINVNLTWHGKAELASEPFQKFDPLDAD